MVSKIRGILRDFIYRRGKVVIAKRLQHQIDSLAAFRRPTEPFYEEADQAAKRWERQLKRLQS